MSSKSKWRNITERLDGLFTARGIEVSVSVDSIKIAHTMAQLRKGYEVALGSAVFDQRMGKVGTHPNVRLRFLIDKSEVVETYYFDRGHVGMAECLKRMPGNAREVELSCGDTKYSFVEIKGHYAPGISETLDRLDFLCGGEH